MLTYIVRRLALLVIVALGVTILTFIMMHLAPGDPAEMIAMALYGLENLTVENVEDIRIIEGFDSPVWIQYLHW
jgi:peptide/nickel transport system permease protein